MKYFYEIFWFLLFVLLTMHAANVNDNLGNHQTWEDEIWNIDSTMCGDCAKGFRISKTPQGLGYRGSLRVHFSFDMQLMLGYLEYGTGTWFNNCT